MNKNCFLLLKIDFDVPKPHLRGGLWVVTTGGQVIKAFCSATKIEMLSRSQKILAEGLAKPPPLVTK